LCPQLGDLVHPWFGQADPPDAGSPVLVRAAVPAILRGFPPPRRTGSAPGGSTCTDCRK